MAQKPPATVPRAVTDAGSETNRYTIVFVIVWVVLTAVLSIMLYRGDRGNREVQTIVKRISFQKAQSQWEYWNPSQRWTRFQRERGLGCCLQKRKIEDVFRWLRRPCIR